MALEKFACEPLLLKRVARHFSGEAKLEDSVISKIKLCLGRDFRWWDSTIDLLEMAYSMIFAKK